MKETSFTFLQNFPPHPPSEGYTDAQPAVISGKEFLSFFSRSIFPFVTSTPSYQPLHPSSTPTVEAEASLISIMVLSLLLFVPLLRNKHITTWSSHKGGPFSCKRNDQTETNLLILAHRVLKMESGIQSK